MKKTILSHFLKGCLKSLFVIIVSLFAMSFNVPKNDSQLFLKSTSNAPDKNISIINSNKVIKINKDNGYFLGAYPQVLPACSTASVSFICSTPDYGATSGTWSFHWTIGSGWTNSGSMYTTSNIIFLTPSSPSITPGSISVVAYFTNNNGNTSGYNVGSCSVSRVTTFTSDAVINGNNVCSGSSVFNITGLKVNENVIWSLSNPSLATLSNSSNTQTTVNMTGVHGSGDLIATITNACGQSVQKLFSLYSGPPSFNEFICFSADGHDFCSGLVDVQSSSMPFLGVKDRINASFSGMTSAERNNSANWEWEKLNNNITLSKTLNVAKIGLIYFGQTGVKVRAKNACGWSDWQQLDFDIRAIFEYTSKSVSVNSDLYEVSPNPANDVINVNLKKNEIPVSDNLKKSQCELFDMQGNLKKKIVLEGKNDANIVVSDLKKGIYLLKIKQGGNTENHRIIIN